MASLLRRSGAATVAHLLRYAHPRRLATVPPARYLPRHDVVRHDPPVNWGFAVVPEERVFVVERFGKYLKTLRSGIHLLVPVVDRIAYVHSLKEEVVSMEHFAVTKDKVPLGVNAAFTFRIIDPYLASYVAEHPVTSALDLVETVLKEKLEKIPFYRTSEMKNELNDAIMRSVDKLAREWGLKCCRYTIKSILQQVESRENIVDSLRRNEGLLDLINKEVVESRTQILKAFESNLKSHLSALVMDLKEKPFWTRILMAIVHFLLAALPVTVVGIFLYGHLYPEEFLEFQDRVPEGYANSAKFVLSGGWLGETLAERYRRENVDEVNKKKRREDELKRRKEELVEEMLRKKLEELTVLQWIIYRLNAGGRRRAAEEAKRGSRT